ncbi:TPA: helix-turn-helix transcriptional regulator [Enterobacter roggenkampii]|nr:helix-turn-helix transcriptional regulator [Enterobacter roggenkampii]
MPDVNKNFISYLSSLETLSLSEKHFCNRFLSIGLEPKHILKKRTIMELSEIHNYVTHQLSFKNKTEFIIMDENKYYSEGLKFFVSEHLATNTHKLRKPFLLIFFTSKTFWDLPATLLASENPLIAMIFLVDKNQMRTENFPLYPWIKTLSRDASLKDMATVIKEVLQPLSRTKYPRATHTQMLTPREFQVMSALAAGNSVAEVSQMCSINEKVVSTYKRRTVWKLGFRTFNVLCEWLNNAR